MDHRVFGGVNLTINFIGLIFRVIILVIYFWSVGGGLWGLITCSIFIFLFRFEHRIDPRLLEK
jgi:type IV secretory pathway TrbD component